jgi:hypothetical protein
LVLPKHPSSSLPTTAKSGERIKSMIKANKELHELGNGYALFLFAIHEDIDLKKPERVFKKIWLNGQGRKDHL